MQLIPIFAAVFNHRQRDEPGFVPPRAETRVSNWMPLSFICSMFSFH